MIGKIFIVATILLFSAGIYVADSKNLSNLIFSASSSWADAQGEIREDYLVLDSKQSDCVSVKNKRFRISETTVIINSLEKTISLAELTVPCRAKMTYYHNPQENIFEIISIEVLDNSLP